MTSIGKNDFFDALDDIDDKYNNTYHNTIKIKPKDVKDGFFAKYNEDFNEKEVLNLK